MRPEYDAAFSHNVDAPAGGVDGTADFIGDNGGVVDLAGDHAVKYRGARITRYYGKAIVGMSIGSSAHG